MKQATTLLSLLSLSSALLFTGCGTQNSPPSFTIGGTVVNLSPASGHLVLQNNLKDSLTVTANGRFMFRTPIASGGSYSVTISVQPSNPAQTCGVTNGSGTATASITNVQVNCGHNEWAWEKGAATVNSNPVYGTQGAAAMNNTPGGRQLPVTWTDTSGGLWLFGGFAFDTTGNTYVLANDLWKFSSGQWTWMGGSNVGNQAGIYGTLGVPSTNNLPGGRYKAVTWTDPSGSVWLLGGTGCDSAGSVGSLNDLWKYSQGQWTWMSGSNTVGQHGNYGTLGVPSSGNVPGARIEAVGWTDSAGNLWLFGGFGLDSAGTNGMLSDLWKYSAVQWTWVSGSNLVNQNGAYGMQGVPGPGNAPGGRESAASWADSSGNFWLFGGIGYGSTGQSGFLNDLWKYSNGQWSWMSGFASPTQSGVYGTQGVASASNIPGARQNAVSWTDSSANLWLFGGNAIDSVGNTGLLNDLWKYNNGEWTWVFGSKLINQNGMYGTQGTLGPGNIPGARLVASGWIDANGNLWLFGGFGTSGSGTEGNLNDLWMYMP